ncbi:hypothetical protein [Kitasatospora sp. DSM 101779]|uniref:hypothetical protein n=1 Tax=Kitasatospora sp. DSM 101779 TaxID=2853165 RepID=UPI0021D83C84|nr:hypothetical protein [Kitasatospora sp. DSM 101779]MCU7820261.1 hypothetical protein [Kitasatospora sp. DSM 101779]
MLDEDNDAEDRADDRDGDRTDRPPRPYRPGPEDTFWLVLLALIVVVCGLIGFLSHGDPGPGGQNITGWH